MTADETHSIVFLDRETLAPEVTLRRPGFAHTWTEYDHTAPEEVLERARDAAIVINNKVPLRAATLEQLPRLQMIAVTATGIDCIDTDWCAAHDVPVANVAGYAGTTVPEHTFALVLALRRQLIGYRDAVAAGRWQSCGQFCFFLGPIQELRGSRLGIFGEGTIGQAVAEIGRGFGMHPVFAAHKGVEGLGPLYTPFDEVIETADVLTLHCPLLPQTRNMIAMAELERMRPGAILVNTARGGLVNEADLATALRRGLIAGAAFDVATPPEPPAADSPLMGLLDLPNFILTPHVAWASLTAQQTLADRTIENIEAFAAGRQERA